MSYEDAYTGVGMRAVFMAGTVSAGVPTPACFAGTSNDPLLL